MPPPYQIPDWQAAAAQKRQSILSAIDPSHLLPPSSAPLPLPFSPTVLSSGILTPLDLEITSIASAARLASLIADRTYTSVQVVSAFVRRASLAHQLTNCLTEPLFASALLRAQQLDAYQDSNDGAVVGALHGVPVSVKDTFDVSGCGTTVGLASWLGNVASRDSAVVEGLRRAGAVVLAKTNTSQACLMVETINNVFGTTTNPANASLSVGGSSGGEAALVASWGSSVGTGTDGGGSIRFPAAFCGLWGLKCSKGRVPGRGCSGVASGSESVNMGIGPMARTVDSLELWMGALLAGKPWERDPSCVPMAWNAEEARRPEGLKRKLKFAVLWDDGVVHPTPPVTRALREVVELLKAAGHTVVDLPAEEMKHLHRRSLACTMKSNVQSGGKAVLAHIAESGEPVVPRTATGTPETSLLTTDEVFANHLERSRLAAAYNDLWSSSISEATGDGPQEEMIDAILAPAVAHPACPHGKYVSNSYATVYNMLDYTAGSVPVTMVDQDLDVATPEWYTREPYPRIEEKLFPYDWGDKEMQELYEGPKVYENSPVGVQIVCQRLREEKLVGILKEVEGLLANR